MSQPFHAAEPCPDDGAPRADHVRVTTCEHGHVFFHLVDRADAVFAIAPFDPDQAIAAGEALAAAGRACLAEKAADERARIN